MTLREEFAWNAKDLKSGRNSVKSHRESMEKTVNVKNAEIWNKEGEEKI